MNVDCLYVTYTPLGDLCTLANKECDYLEDCEEPEWEYLMKLAEEYKEDDTRTI